MIEEFAWFERRFSFDLPVWMFPNIVERLRGTPARVEELVATLSPAVLTQRDGDEWSIQENVGHLWDLEPLWAGRVDDIFNHQTVMREADLQNRKTYEADHNASLISDILRNFRSARAEWVVRLDAMTEADIQRSALHPRLQQPMRIIDLAFFVAEHDDHHLAQITRLKHKFGQGT
jgi:uncharacterized damage-inducible protein DinB